MPPPRQQHPQQQQQQPLGPEYVARRLRLRRRLRATVFTLVVLVVASILLPRVIPARARPGGALPRPSLSGDDWSRFDRRSFAVRRVIDGDTVELAPPDGGAVEVRLLGIDAPSLDGEHGAEAARDELRARAEGRTVALRLEPTETRDGNGRLLAYAYLDDAENVNLALVRDGFAYADRRSVHTFRRAFEQAEAEARRRGRGLWRDVTEARMPAWRQEWLRRQKTRGARE
jgi:micrococcal nuclease